LSQVWEMPAIAPTAQNRRGADARVLSNAIHSRSQIRQDARPYLPHVTTAIADEVSE